MVTIRGIRVYRLAYESVSRLSSHQAGRPLLAALQPDANPERGLSGAHREREPRRAALAVAAQEREHAAQAHPRGGVLFRAGRHGPDARGRRDVDRAANTAACWSGRTSCARCSTTPTPRCSGSSSARRRNWNFCKAQNPRWTSRSFTRLTRSNCQRNWPAWSGRRRVD